MSKVVFILPNGARREIMDLSAANVMEIARHNGVAEILGDCGGSLTCGTCHAFVDPDWVERVAPPSPEELELLEGVAGREPNSRLTCQLALSPELDGIIIRLPEQQLDY